PIVESVGGSITRDYSFLLLVAVGIVLLITCSNIANLQLARSMSRQRELAVRAALGASRLRIARLLLTENFLMAILGGAASIGLANWSLNLMGSSMPADIARQIPGWYEIRFDTRALLYTLAIALVSGMLTGLMPAFASSRTALNQSLKQSERSWGTGRSHQRLRGAFVIAQIVVALVLVIAATLMVKGFRRFVNVQENYSPEHLLIVAVNLPESRYKTAADRESFYRRALDKLHSISGVVSADTFYTIPLSNNGTQWIHFTIEGRTPGGSLRQYPGAILQQVSPDYLQALNIPLVAVRTFTDADRDGSQPVAMVSQKLARAYWPGDTAIGRHIRIGGPDSKQPWLTIVGVTSNVLYDWTDQLPELAIYVPYMQSPPSETLLAIRTNGQPAKNYAKPARAAIAGIDPDLPAFNVMPLSQAIHESIVGLAIVGDMMAVLGAIALIIALVGVYGVMSYAVAERTHEFGVRMALGARPRDILWLVSRRGILLVSASVAIGLPLSIALARLLAGLIYGASAIDWRVFGGVTTLLTIVAFLASYIPARRAMRVDPMVALRYE
ncbi:MAG: FtsX-like permease family protein, partial [Candidatus Acidiferrales bacterium]